MQTWVVPGSTVRGFVDAAAMAGLVDAIGSRDPAAIANAVLDAVRPMAAAQHCTVFAHEGQRGPRLLSGADDNGPWVAFRCGAVHARAFASQDPVRELIERKPAAGPVGIVVLARVRLGEMPIGNYREECMEALHLVDRLSLLMRVAECNWLAVHLYRDEAHGCFGDEAIEALVGVASLLTRCVARHYACDVDGLGSVRGNVTEGITELGARLTDREREVLTRILDGVTVNRIAEDLKLRPTTVATYRMRAYEKLGIASRQELFATMLRRRAVGAGQLQAA